MSVEISTKTSEEEIQKFCKERKNMACFKTSAKTGVQVKEAFNDIIGKAIREYCGMYDCDVLNSL